MLIYVMEKKLQKLLPHVCACTQVCLYVYMES